MVSLTTLAVAVVALLQCTATHVDATSMPTRVWPTSTGTITSPQAITVPAGMTFDGKMQTFERSDITCKGQVVSGTDTAMFIVEAGATLKNVIIGRNQMKGVRCDNHDCTIDNVWWTDVCEDAVTIKGGNGDSLSRVMGGGAQYADDAIVQHNGAGTVLIDRFYAFDFGQLYRSCGTCGAIQRNVIVSNFVAVNPTASVVTVNSNYGDTATLRNIRVQAAKKDVDICAKMISKGSGEPVKWGSGPDSTVCKYTEKEVVLTSPASQSTASLRASTPSLPAASPALAARSLPDPSAQGILADAQSPGRVQASPSSTQFPSEGTAAAPLNPQSLNFDSPSPEPASKSFGFQRLRG